MSVCAYLPMTMSIILYYIICLSRYKARLQFATFFSVYRDEIKMKKKTNGIQWIKWNVWMNEWMKLKLNKTKQKPNEQTHTQTHTKKDKRKFNKFLSKEWQSHKLIAAHVFIYYTTCTMGIFISKKNRLLFNYSNYSFRNLRRCAVMKLMLHRWIRAPNWDLNPFWSGFSFAVFSYIPSQIIQGIQIRPIFIHPLMW